MLKPNINESDGILIDEGSASRLNASIHMFFMNFDIAVIWLDPDFRVVGKVLARKWKPYYAPEVPARYILETHPNRLDDFEIGDKVSIENA
jgi:uncharacterized membrane protein (UPF0127 family)